MLKRYKLSAYIKYYTNINRSDFDTNCNKLKNVFFKFLSYYLKGSLSLHYRFTRRIRDITYDEEIST